MTYRFIAIAALVCTPALAQAPPQLQTTPLSRGLESSASSEPGTAERQVLGGSAAPPATGRPGDVALEPVGATKEGATRERQVGGWSAGSLMGAGPARPEGAAGDGAAPAGAQPNEMRSPPDYNGTANGGPN